MNALHPVGLQPKHLSSHFRISPYLYSQSGLLNVQFLPKKRDLPDGIDYRAKTYDFGYNDPTQILEPFNTQYSSLTLARNFLIWGITGVSQVQPGQTPLSPAFLFQISQTHDGEEALYFNKAVTDLELAGTAQEPYILKSPALVLAADQLKVTVQNLGNVNLQVQITLHGGEFA